MAVQSPVDPLAFHKALMLATDPSGLGHEAEPHALKGIRVKAGPEAMTLLGTR